MTSELLNPREQDVFKQVVEFCQKEVAPYCEQWEKDENLPREIFTKAGKLGLMGMNTAPALGGLGLRYVASALIVQEMAKYYAALALDIAAHNALSVGHIVAFGSEEQKKRVVPKLVSGEWIGAWALTEPSAGSDTGGLATTATQTDKGWEITGHKMFITQGQRADLLVVMAVTGTNAQGKKEITSFLVEKKHVIPVRKILTYGVKSSDTAELRFDKAPAELLGERGHGQEYALTVLDRGRIGVASLAVGIAQAALDHACTHALHRKQFGKAIADFEAIQWMIADSATELEAARLMTLRAAELQDQGKRSTKESAMAKLYTSEVANRVCNRALQIHGGQGYTRDHPVERYLRDAKICEIGEGTSEVQRIVISRHILKSYEDPKV